jgi:DNA replication licensing factor MCM5
MHGCPPCARRAQEEAEFRAYAARPDVLDAIPARIAPQIFGSERIKEAVACLLFGGSRKVLRKCC